MPTVKAKVNNPIRTFNGTDNFTFRLVFSFLSRTPVRFIDIRTHNPEDPTAVGLEPHEISFLRLLDKISNGTYVEINETGTRLLFSPGFLLGSQGTQIHHLATPTRPLAYYILPLLLLMPYCKTPLSLSLQGCTNPGSLETGQAYPGVDSIMQTTVPFLRHLGFPEIHMKIVFRSAYPNGQAGKVLLSSGSVLDKPIASVVLWNPAKNVVLDQGKHGKEEDHDKSDDNDDDHQNEDNKQDDDNNNDDQDNGDSTDKKKKKIRGVKRIRVGALAPIKRIRGVAYTTRIAPTIANRMVDQAKSALATITADVFIHTDHSSSKRIAGSSSSAASSSAQPPNLKDQSPGFGIALVAETTDFSLLGADWNSNGQSMTKIYTGHKAFRSNTPEQVAKNAANLLLEEISQGGMIDTTNQPLSVICMALSNDEQLSKIRLGRLSTLTIQVLRDLRDFFGIMFKVQPDRVQGANTVLLSCIGLGLSNVARRTF